MADVIRSLDTLLRRRRWTALPLAVAKKFGDDSAGGMGAMIAYYGFVAIFPLLLVFSTILGYALRGNFALQHRLVNSALVDFPVIGPQLRTGTLSGHWYVILVSAVISVWGARGVANAAQDALNTIWGVPYARRPGFPATVWRGFALLAVAGLAVVTTGLLSGIGSADSAVGWALRVGALCLSAAINIGLFLLGFRLAIAREVPTRCMMWSAVASAIIWQVLLAAGSLLLAHQVRHATELYGTFGIVLGLLGWLHLQAQLTLYAVEYEVVRVRRLWPRSLLQPPLTGGDKRAYRSYAELTRRRPLDEQRIEVSFSDDGGGTGAPPTVTPGD